MPRALDIRDSDQSQIWLTFEYLQRDAVTLGDVLALAFAKLGKVDLVVVVIVVRTHVHMAGVDLFARRVVVYMFLHVLPLKNGVLEINNGNAIKLNFLYVPKAWILFLKTKKSSR